MKNIKYIAALFLSVCIASCAEDKGNYNYTDINEVKMSGFDASYYIEKEQRFIIDPEISQTLADNPDVLEYEWIIRNQVVSTSRNLDYTVPADMPFGKGVGRYIVTDSSNGMKYFKEFNYTVTNPFGFGYYVLTEKQDGSSEIAFLSATVKDAGFLYTNMIGGYKLGDKPQKIAGGFSRLQEFDGYFWIINIVTQQGEYPCIETNNANFMPSALISRTGSFLESNKGYVFEPTDILISINLTTVFVCGGKTIYYKSGLLYRPDNLTGYDWGKVTISWTGTSLAAFDRNSRKLYLLEPTPDDIIHGIPGDKYAFDRARPFDIDFTDRDIIGTQAPKEDGDDVWSIRFFSASPSGIHIDKYIMAVDNTQEHPESVTLPITGANSNSIALPTPDDEDTKAWYVSVGNTIYFTPDLLPELEKFATIPSELGEIVNMQMSASRNNIVVTLYNEQSSHAHKGSLVLIDAVTKEQTVHANVCAKPVSLLCADGSPWE